MSFSKIKLLLIFGLSLFSLSLGSKAANASNYANWPIKSIDAMKVTRGTLCPTQIKNRAYMDSWLDKAKELGAEYVAISTPYNNPQGTPTDCAGGSPTSDTIPYTREWLAAARAKGFKIWHRHTFAEFEGMYARPKVTGINFIPLIDQYIRANPDFFQDGDIFTPIPEPQNGGIRNTTCGTINCQFDGTTDDEARAKFNTFLRDSMTTSSTAFASIGLANKVKIGYFGFSGFVAWGHLHSYWGPRCGILEPETFRAMGNVTIDHYPQEVGTTMGSDLTELENCIVQKVGATDAANIPVIIGEWGTTSPTNPEQLVLDTMTSAKNDPKVIGFNYWTLGPGGGNEALINDDFTNRLQFDEVQSFFKNPNILTGDINNSGKVDIFDYNFLITDYGTTSGTGLRSDLNASGKVDIFDYNLLVTNYGKTVP